MCHHPTDDVPFSLTCSECDAGMEIGTLAEALALGWQDIELALDLPMANYLGLCPACKAHGEDKVA